MFNLKNLKYNRRISPEPDITELDIKKNEKKCYHYIITTFIGIEHNTDQVVYYCNKCLSTFKKYGDNYKLQYINEGPPFYILSFN